VTPVINAGYNITFKLIDRGILEAFGSTTLSTRLNSIFNDLRV